MITAVSFGFKKLEKDVDPEHLGYLFLVTFGSDGKQINTVERPKHIRDNLLRYLTDKFVNYSKEELEKELFKYVLTPIVEKHNFKIGFSNFGFEHVLLDRTTENEKTISDKIIEIHESLLRLLKKFENISEDEEEY